MCGAWITVTSSGLHFYRGNLRVTVFSVFNDKKKTAKLNGVPYVFNMIWN